MYSIKMQKESKTEDGSNLRNLNLIFTLIISERGGQSVQLNYLSF